MFEKLILVPIFSVLSFFLFTLPWLFCYFIYYPIAAYLRGNGGKKFEQKIKDFLLKCPQIWPNGPHVVPLREPVQEEGVIGIGIEFCLSVDPVSLNNFPDSVLSRIFSSDSPDSEVEEINNRDGTKIRVRHYKKRSHYSLGFYRHLSLKKNFENLKSLVRELDYLPDDPFQGR